AEPAREYIEHHGGEVRLGATARILTNDAGDAVIGVDAVADRIAVDRVVSAVPWFAFADLFEGEPPALQGTIDRARRLAPVPIVPVNRWLDRPVLSEPFVGLPGRTMQWVFDKRLVIGDSANHLSLVSSGATPVVAKSNDELIQIALDEIVEALPPARAAKLLRATVVREP